MGCLWFCHSPVVTSINTTPEIISLSWQYHAYWEMGIMNSNISLWKLSKAWSLFCTGKWLGMSNGYIKLGKAAICMSRKLWRVSVFNPSQPFQQSPISMWPHTPTVLWSLHNTVLYPMSILKFKYPFTSLHPWFRCCDVFTFWQVCRKVSLKVRFLVLILPLTPL